MARTVVIPIIIANIIMFFLQLSLGRGFTDALLLNSDTVFYQPWTLLTSMFLHGSLGHIMINMYILFIFGMLLEQRIGVQRFAVIYFVSGIVAGILSAILYPLLLGEHLRALGASGAVMGILGVIIILMPNLRVLFFFFIPMPLWIAAIIFAAIDILGIFYPSGIANIAHLAGMGTGLLYGRHLKQHSRRFHRRFSRKTYMDSGDVDEYLKSGRI